MSSPPLKRRLTTILASDAVGYSRLVSESEEEALRVLAAHRAVIDGIIEFHEGRIINTAGDSVLAEFASPVQAVRCAVEIQDALKTRNDALPERRRMLFRIGVNLGDVMVKGDDLLGDGANVAARLESIAEPGGICISSSVYDQITGKLNLSLSDMGEQALKNITRPIRAYRIQGGASLAAAPAPAKPKPRRRPWWLAATLVTLAAAAAGLWLQRLQPPRPVATQAAPPPPDAVARERAQAAAEAQHAREEAAAVRRAAEADAARIRAEAEAAKAKAEADALRARAKADAEARRAREKAQADAARIEAQAAAKRQKEEAAAQAAAKAREKTAARAAAQQREKAAPAVAMSAPAPQAAATAPSPDPARFDGAWHLKLSCPAWNGVRSRESEADATMTAGKMVAKFGYNGHPGFFRVHGALADDDTLVLHGGGIAGGRFRGRAFPIRIPGRFEGTSYRGEGHFGHRQCVVTLQR